MIHSKKIRGSAEREMCTVNIAGFCVDDRESTVLAHFPDGSGGSNKLNGDLCAGYACHVCHDILDDRISPNQHQLKKSDKEFYMRRSQIRTLHRLLDKGILKVE